MIRRADGHGQLINAAFVAWFGACRYTKSERKPRDCSRGSEKKPSRGTLDHPILSQGINQARHRLSPDFDVLADGVVVGRIFKANAVPVRRPAPA